jgi:hypothetical protein
MLSMSCPTACAPPPTNVAAANIDTTNAALRRRPIAVVLARPEAIRNHVIPKISAVLRVRPPSWGPEGDASQTHLGDLVAPPLTLRACAVGAGVQVTTRAQIAVRLAAVAGMLLAHPAEFDRSAAAVEEAPLTTDHDRDVSVPPPHLPDFRLRAMTVQR